MRTPVSLSTAKYWACGSRSAWRIMMTTASVMLLLFQSVCAAHGGLQQAGRTSSALVAESLHGQRLAPSQPHFMNRAAGLPGVDAVRGWLR